MAPKSKQAGFFKTLKQNPNSSELNEAFANYTKKTGKHPKEMSYDDINHYVEEHRSKSKEKKSGGVEMISKQSSITITAGVAGMMSKIAPTITKGLAGAGKAMAGSTSKGRAMVGGAIGAAGGALKDPGVDPVTGQRKSRLTGALAGAGLGAAAGHYAPQAVGGAQKLMGKLTPGA